MNLVRSTRWSLGLALFFASTLVAKAATDDGPFARFELPDAWESRFWAEPNVVAAGKLDLKDLAKLIPTQAGLRHCRCPKCGAGEGLDPLSWSVAHPEVLTCRRCGKTVPDADTPAKVDNKIPEEVVEVLPRVFHHYPYHAVEAEKQFFPDERVYLNAKRDHEAREFFSKLALYAAVRGREKKDAALSRLGCVILLRFAQVYPAYATHFDQPEKPKYLDRADLPAPYRRNYGTGKWDSSGCLSIPLDLVVAFALLRESPEMAEAGKILNDPHPRKTIERDLLLASADFARRQPVEDSELTLYIIRGILAVGRCLDDPGLIHEGLGRLDEFLTRGFYFDGVWRYGDAASQRRVVDQIDGWIGRLLEGYVDPPDYRPIDGRPRISHQFDSGLIPTLGLARAVDPRPIDPRSADVQLASWPSASPAPKVGPRRPVLLGGAGIVRLGVGSGDDALDVEMRGVGDFGNRPSGRLALRMSVGGRPVLGDLDDAPPSPWGFDRSTASRNLVVVDGLNQRENLADLREPAPGSDVLFFAADPDFQVAMMADRYAYPRSAQLYRQTVILASGAKTRYAVSLFEIGGGLQHDQIFHGPSRSSARWKLSAPTQKVRETLLPSNIPFVDPARPEEGRWFVQGMGAFSDLSEARLEAPAQAELLGPERPGVRLHVLPRSPITAISSISPDSSADGRGSLILRRRSGDGQSLATEFVTVFEPIGVNPPLRRVGRVASPSGTIVLAIEAKEGMEFLVINPKASDVAEVTLPDGQNVRTDALVVRLGTSGAMMAGGTFADVGDRRLAQTRAHGTIKGTRGERRKDGLGAFLTADPLPDPGSLTGRNLLIRHGDGTSRGWTIVGVENPETGGGVIHVREQNGFHLEPKTGAASYDQFPRLVAPGPHEFGISKIAR